MATIFGPWCVVDPETPTRARSNHCIVLYSVDGANPISWWKCGLRWTVVTNNCLYNKYDTTSVAARFYDTCGCRGCRDTTIVQNSILVVCVCAVVTWNRSFYSDTTTVPVHFIQVPYWSFPRVLLYYDSTSRALERYVPITRPIPWLHCWQK